MMDKVAVVTGAGQGIGRACALMFAEAGANVVVADINGPNTVSVADEVKALGRDALAFEADTRSEAHVQRIVDETMRHFGRLDVAVNNVGGNGGQPNRPVLELTTENWDGVLDVSLRSTVLCARAFATQMVASGTKGSIVNIASVAGVRGSPNMAPYAAAKAGVISLTQTLAIELAGYGIRVNCVAPGFVATPALKSLMSDEVMQRLAESSVPLRRAGEPEDIAGAVLMLASDMTAYVTGQTLISDGGRVCLNPLTAQGEWPEG
jgi:NAD(P)-dependent dehydrogenase (short-subunit alcohol dehydrogenase family)